MNMIRPQSVRTILEVRNLSLGFGLASKPVKVVEDVSFDLRAGETLCIVGESGSGKSVTAKALMRIGAPARLLSGSISFQSANGDATDIAALSDNSPEMRTIRGNRIAMVFQEPMSSLSPVHSIGQQIVEAILLHRDMTKTEARAEAVSWLQRVGIPAPEEAIDKYSFEFSGGMRQRAMIAMALACRPDILIADEPTTALDVTTQANILRLIRDLQAELGMSVIFITHDIGVVAEIADRVAVMHHGRMIEVGETSDIFHNPREPYTRHLINSSSKFTIHGTGVRKGTRPTPDAETLLSVRNINLSFRKRRGLIRRRTLENRALRDVSFDLKAGENLGIVGESGSGKTTLVRSLVGLLQPESGSARYRKVDGTEIELLTPGGLRREGLNGEIRMVFQDPFSSLNPRMTVEQVIAEPLVVAGQLTRRQMRDRVAELLEQVDLPEQMMSRYPHAFSGGQRQRISIARALAVRPRLIIADEATSALDGSVRSRILDLMFDLQTRLGLSYIFVAHDLGVVRYFCDRIAVMKDGALVELGDAEDVCMRSRHPYTKELIAAVPSTNPSDKRLIRMPAEGVSR